MAEYIAKRLNGKPAKFAGDELNPAQGYKTTNRKFGLIYIVGNEGRVDPGAGPQQRGLRRRARQTGHPPRRPRSSYIYDPGRNQQDVTADGPQDEAGRASPRSIPMVDPLYPILITQEATRQQYFPEWLILGFGLSDTTAAGRLYDQLQWRHAFGISPLWVTWAHVNRSGGYRAFHHGMPGMRPGDEGVLINIYATYAAWLFTGIHMAGPNLTADTFAKGMYSYPRTGGDVGHPTRAVHVGRRRRRSRTSSRSGTTPTPRAPTSGRSRAPGMMMKSDGGKRYVARPVAPGRHQGVQPGRRHRRQRRPTRRRRRPPPRAGRPHPQQALSQLLRLRPER